MPIKDQCHICRYNREENCIQQVPTFDGTSCDLYRQRINLEKENKKTPPPEQSPMLQDSQAFRYSQDSEVAPSPTLLPPAEKIRGWLLFFLICFVGIGSVASLGSNIIHFDPDAFALSIADVVLGALYFLVGLFTIIAFVRRDSDAVFLAKTYIISCFLINIFTLVFLDEDDLGSSKDIAQMIRSIIWCGIWYIFMFCSSQVQQRIPKWYRRTKTRDWVLVAVLVLWPFATIGVAIKEAVNSPAERIFEDWELADNQRTDGIVILTIPEGNECEMTETDDQKVFKIVDNENGEQSIIVSTYDDNATQSYFDELWGYSTENLNGHSYEILGENAQTLGNQTIFYRWVRIDNVTDWEYTVVFDKPSGKMTIISTYSVAGSESHVAEILNSLIFS